MDTSCSRRSRFAGRLALTAVSAAVLSAVLGLAAGPALASCIEPPPLATALTQGPAVFVGTVTSVDNAGRDATVGVSVVWRGDVARRVVVSGSSAQGQRAVTSVDRSFEVGTTYLFVPYRGAGTHFDDNACSATRPYAADLAAFAPVGVTPPAPAADKPRGSDSGLPMAPVWVASVLLTVIALVTGLAYGVRRFGLRRPAPGSFA